MKFNKTLLSLSVVVALQACGGGSGDENNSGTNGNNTGGVGGAAPADQLPEQNKAVVTADNYQDFAQSSYQSGQRDTGDGVPANAGGQRSKSGIFHAKTIKNAVSPDDNGIDCIAGSVIFEPEIGEVLPKKGDTYTITYDNCTEAANPQFDSPQITRNGTMTVEFLTDIDIEPQSEEPGYKYRATHSNYTESIEGEDTFMIDGVIETNIEVNEGEVAITTNYFETTLTYGGESIVYNQFEEKLVESFSNEGFTMEQTFDGIITFKGEGDLAGSFEVMTELPLTSDVLSFNPVPEQGRIVMKSGDATITQVFQGKEIVISLDEDGDGTPEEEETLDFGDFANIDDIDDIIENPDKKDKGINGYWRHDAIDGSYIVYIDQGLVLQHVLYEDNCIAEVWRYSLDEDFAFNFEFGLTKDALDNAPTPIKGDFERFSQHTLFQNQEDEIVPNLFTASDESEFNLAMCEGVIEVEINDHGQN